MKIPYFIRNVYGKPQAYVASAELRHSIRMLTRRECLDAMDLTALAELGHEPHLVHDPESLKVINLDEETKSRPLVPRGSRATTA